MSAATLPPGSRVSEVALTVSDLARARDFYEGRLGLVAGVPGGSGGGGMPGGSGGSSGSSGSAASDGTRLALGAPDGAFLRLVHDPRAQLVQGAARLYHFAILYPSRGELAAAVRRLLQARWPLQGASDHLVSEAVYLADPEGNGIELYRDRPSVEWTREGGQLRMATLPLDLPGLLAEPPDVADVADGGPAPSAPVGTTLGHIHLHVRDLAEAERFYREVVGLELTVRYGGSASFLAAGGYHHHVGINTWGTAGARPAVEGALGLRWYRLALPDAGALSALGARLRAAGVPYAQEDGEGGELRFSDPSGHRLVAGAVG